MDMGQKVSIPKFGHDGGQPFAANQNHFDTCRWCGRKLRPCRYTGSNDPVVYGDYGDGYFCGLRCGYRFAVTFAAKGHWLQQVVSDPAIENGKVTVSTTEAWEGRDE